MKNVFLSLGIFILSVSSFNCYSQDVIKEDDLIGWWMADVDFCDMFFWKDANNELQVQQISNTNGTGLILSEFVVTHESVFIKCSEFKPGTVELQATTLNYFKFIDDLTIECFSKDIETKELRKIVYSKVR